MRTLMSMIVGVIEPYLKKKELIWELQKQWVAFMKS